MRRDIAGRCAVVGVAIVALLGAGCASRRPGGDVEIEVEDTVTTTSTGSSSTTLPRGPAPGWERRGDH